jgi:flagellin-like protein
MKGVSAVIAIVLILMITVALAAMAYVWFTTVFEELARGAEGKVNQTTDILGTSIDIEAAAYVSESNISVSIRNSGTTNIEISGIGYFINELPVSSISGPTGTLGSNEIGNFIVENTSAVCPGPTSIKVSVPGYDKTRSIACP